MSADTDCVAAASPAGFVDPDSLAAAPDADSQDAADSQEADRAGHGLCGSDSG
jgi:hypothetical protein